MGCLFVVVPLQEGGRTFPRVAELHWSNVHGKDHTPGNGVNPSVESRQGSQSNLETG